MPDETLKPYWEIVSQIRRDPSQQAYAAAITQSTDHPSGKVRSALLAFLAERRKKLHVA